MYKRLYFFLFNRITDAIASINEGRNGDALKALMQAQSDAEQMFVDDPENDA